MKLRYYAEFKSRKEKVYRVEIYTVLSTYAEELTLSDTPFTVEYESDTLFKPLKMSNAVATVLTDKILTDLYTGEGQSIEVRLYNLTDNKLEWFGFMSPNLYSSDYITPVNSLELQAIDTIAVLENKKYTYIDDSAVYFKSLKDVIFHILDMADPNKLLNKFYFQKTNSISKGAATSLIEDIYIHERNFFDEADEPMNARDVLEEIAKYLGMTIIQYQDAYYMIDYDFINKENLNFFVYDRSKGICESRSFSPMLYNVQSIGVAESSGSISLGDVYNKITVVANMNQITDLCPKLIDDDKDIVNQNKDPNKYYISNQNIDDKNYTLLNAFFKSKANWEYQIPERKINKDIEKIEEVTIDNVNSIISGVVWQKYADYITDDGEPSSISWKSCVSFIENHKNEKNEDVIGIIRLRLKNCEYGSFKGGYFILNLTYKMTTSNLPNDVVKSLHGDEKYKYSNSTGNFGNTMIPCRLKVGNYYFDGEVWRNMQYYIDRMFRGYYKQVRCTIGVWHTTNGQQGYYEDVQWYRFKDSYGDWRFVTKDEYDSSTAEKTSGGYEDPSIVYSYRSMIGRTVYIEKWFYEECRIEDGFYLVHENKEGDPILDEEKKLTNTVSYRLNLHDSTDGVLIKLPEDILLCGSVYMEIWSPNDLGGYPGSIKYEAGPYCDAFHISDFTFKYTTSNGTQDIFRNIVDESDVVYSNVINDNNVTEMDDIDLLVNSNAKGISSYSNSVVKRGDNFDYVKTIYSPLQDKDALPEQIIIDKFYAHYKEPKFQYSNVLNRGFSILSKIRENSLHRDLLVNKTDVDYANESCNISLIEL